jgi:hypothetical protein
LYAVFFPHGVRFFLRRRMTRRVGPVKNGHRAHTYAHTVSVADFPVNRYVRPMYTELCGRSHWAPDVVSVVLVGNRSFLLKIRIYWQNRFTLSYMEKCAYLAFFPILLFGIGNVYLCLDQLFTRIEATLWKNTMFS